MMRSILLLVLALSMGACAHHQKQGIRYLPPSPAKVVHGIGATRVAIAAKKTETTAVKSEIAAAKVTATEIFKAAAPDLRPLVEKLQTELDAAGQRADQAIERADAAEKNAAEASAATAELDVLFKKQADQLTEQSKTIVQLEADKSALKLERDRWRKITMSWRAGFVLVAGLFLGAVCLKIFGWRVAAIPSAIGALASLLLKLIGSS
jgi:hypothetical protein